MARKLSVEEENKSIWASNKSKNADAFAERQAKIDAGNKRYEDYVKTVDGRPKPRQHFDIEMNKADLNTKKAKRASQKLSVDEETYENHMANGGDKNLTFKQWERLPPMGRTRLQRSANERKSIESGGTSFPSIFLPGGREHWEEAAKINNIVPPVTEAVTLENRRGFNPNAPDYDAKYDPILKIKSTGYQSSNHPPPIITGNGTAEASQVPAILQNNRGFTPDKTAVAPIEAVFAENVPGPNPLLQNKRGFTPPKTTEMLEIEAENAPDNTGTGKADSLDTNTFKATNGEGEEIPVDPKQTEGIFNKASDLFGDIFSAPDLKRMTLYTLGGLLTGGSLEGSFKWAGLKVMDEQQIAKTNAAAIEAENVRFERDMYKLDKQYAQDDKKQSTLFGYSKETASILTGARTEAARLIADASLLDSNARAKAQVLANSVMAKATLAAQTLKANALMSAATLKFNRDQNKDKGKATGDTKDWAIEGHPFLTEVTSTEYDFGAAGKKSVVTYLNTNTGLQEQHYLTDFKAMVREMGGGKISENDESVNNRAEQSEIIDKWSQSLREPFVNLFNIAGDEAGIKNLNPEHVIASTGNYWDTRGYDLASPGQRSIAKQASILAAGDAAKHAASTGSVIFSIDPFLDKQVFSVNALGADAGVWQIGDGKGPGVSPAKVIQFRDKIRRMSMLDSDKGSPEGDANKKRTKAKFQSLWSTFKNLSDDEKGNLNPSKDENEFLVWANKLLSIKIKGT